MKLADLHKKYPDGTRAVRGIDLDVAEGSFVVLLGPSGCGKTTTLRMIAGLESVSSGWITIGDRDVTDLPTPERDVGFVFQFYALYPHMTVRQNIGFPLDNQRIAKNERTGKVEATAARLGISDLLDRHPGQLSGGDQQRVSLARAMVRDPVIYLMDEPLGQLDAGIRLELREAIRQQQLDTGVTTVYVTHDQEEALSLGDVVVVMNEGLIEQTGSPEEVYRSPASLFVADFVGSPGMNTISGSVQGEGDEGAFHAGGSVIPLPPVGARGPSVLGIRPESVHLDQEGPIRGTVDVSEYFGDHHILHVSTELGTLTVRSDEGRSAGERTGLSLDPDQICLYSPDTGRRVG